MCLYSEGVEYKAEKMVELISDYDMEIRYHLGKVNVVADALSRKAQVNMFISR